MRRLILFLGALDGAGAKSTPKASAAQARVLQAIEANPGLPMERVAKLLDLSAPTLDYHVKRLASQGLVHAIPAGRRRLLFAGLPGGEHLAETELALLRQAATRAVARAVLESPQSSVAHLCEITGLSRRVVYHHLQRLKKVGLVVTKKARGYREAIVAERVAALLARLSAEGYDK